MLFAKKIVYIFPFNWDKLIKKWPYFSLKWPYKVGVAVMSLRDNKMAVLRQLSLESEKTELNSSAL